MTDSTPGEPGADPIVDAERPSGSIARVLARGSAWALVSQFGQLVINLAFTPFLIHGFGLERYGMFMLVYTITTVMGTFDGGLNQSAQRFFVIFAGRDDRIETTRLLITLTSILAMAGAALSAILWFLAGPLADHLKMSDSLRPEAVFILRTAAILVALTLLRGLPAQILQARQRFAYQCIATLSVYPIYVVGLVLTVHHHWGLRGAAFVLLAQNVALGMLLVPVALRYLSRQGLSFYKWHELRTFLSYSSKVQFTNWSTLFLQEFDTLVIGGVLSVKIVGIYSAGANFASQLKSVTANALGPAMTVLGHAYGRGGEPTLDIEFRRIQRLWVRSVSGFFAVGAGSAYFGVTAWLGNDFRMGGVVAVVLLVGNLIFVSTKTMTMALGIIGRPGLEAKFSVVMIVVNVALTIPLVFVGPIGVVAATVASQIVASLYLVRLVHQKWTPTVRTFFDDLPVVASVISAVATVGIELIIRPWVPHGAFGLVISGLPAGLVLAVYALYMRRTQGGDIETVEPVPVAAL